ncbi:RNA polymerase sigma-70 factor, ECF subfamily [Pedobacter westerhofensis]|uniref:RNA polymerase sigma-70 factor, ECF subfamily n=1 Tax=Pedobacter westerhofensis TaxID=425512 RepID=A0A521B6Y2_9SPHI|nr:RNA polymerase sigma-70 factor [Pedobacter westerhofensis]SMO42862.1 RNA polymerase sigma-70 factor, ECF subfamily [Pedobacter westerhofensis]
MAKYTNLPAEELVSLIKSDDKQAFAEFYDRYKGPLYFQAFRMLGDDEQAKDVVQEMFIRLWETRHSISVKTTVEAYVFRSIRHKVIDFIRHQKTITRYLDSLECYLEKGTAALDESYIEKETLALFRLALASLPARMREVFDLSRNQGLSHKQIAEELCISEHTVKKQINKAIKHLRLRINLSLLSLTLL